MIYDLVTKKVITRKDTTLFKDHILKDFTEYDRLETYSDDLYYEPTVLNGSKFLSGNERHNLMKMKRFSKIMIITMLMTLRWT